LILVLLAALVWRLLSVRAFSGREVKSTNSKVAEPSRSLADDATALANQGTWQSDVLKLKLRDGGSGLRALVIEFAPSAQVGETNAPDAKAKLSTATVPNGPSFAQASSSFGDANFRDVRLRETNGVRTITFTRASDKTDTKQIRRIRERYSVSFAYELKNNVLTLKGFPTNAVTWGVSEFTVPNREITFKSVK